MGGDPAGAARGWPRAVRLRKSAEFDAVRAKGRRVTTPHLVVLYRRTEPESAARFGLAVGRKIGNAVARNRVKRRLREALRHERAGLTGVDVVLIARSSVATVESAALRGEVADALARVRSSR